MIDFTEIKVLSFDCYGTLIDWEQGILSALAELFQNYQLHPQSAVLQSFARWEAEFETGSFLNYHEVLVKVLKEMATEFALDLPNVDLLARSVGNWQPFADTFDALNRLSKRFRLVILSNVDQDMFLATQQTLGIRFDQVLVAEEIGSYKPSLRNFQFMLDRLNQDPNSLLHVAQSLYHDHVPAHQLGIRTAWVNRPSIVPGQGATLPAIANPELVVGSMSELADQLLPDATA